MKTELVIAEVTKNDGTQSMFRSLGRMFVLCPEDELMADLNTDLVRIDQESERSTQLKTVLDAKKDTLTK